MPTIDPSWNLLWKGTLESLNTFMEYLNDNDRWIDLKYEADLNTIHFLDLKIWVERDQLLTSTYFKPTDRK